MGSGGGAVRVGCGDVDAGDYVVATGRLGLEASTGAGAELAYGWHAFLQHPAVGKVDVSVRAGNALFLAGAIALIWFAARRIVETRQD